MSRLISGKTISTQINDELRNEVENLKKRGIEPCLAVILVGHDPASAVYVRNKKRTCAELGIKSVGHDLPETTSQDELENLVNDLNNDASVHGILNQFPLPNGLD